MVSTRTRSGSRSPCWPLTCWSGPKSWHFTANRPASGNPNGYACACWPWPDASSGPDDATTYACPAAGPGATSSKPAGPHYKPPDPQPLSRRSRTRSAGDNATPEPHAAQHQLQTSAPSQDLRCRPHERSRLAPGLFHRQFVCQKLGERESAGGPVILAQQVQPLHGGQHAFGDRIA